MFLFIAFVVGIFGVIPLLFSGKIGTSGIAAASYILVNFGLFYLVAPSLAFPLFGFVGFIALIEICISAGIGSCDDSYGYSSRKRNEPNRFLVWGLPVVAILAYVVTGMSGCAAFRSSEYREMVGKVEKREWTKDVQPKDPRHVRLVPKELAYYLATKQLGEASGAIGSQFSVSEPELTLQMIHGELWYVAPLDLRLDKRRWFAGICDDPRRRS